MVTAFQCLWGLSFSLTLYFIHSTSTSHAYIVYLGLNHTHGPLLTSNYHLHLLATVFASKEDAKQSMLYSYKHSFSGFSAKLNSSQAATLAQMEGVISVFKSKTHELHTTRSWDFMGLTLDYPSDDVIPLQLAYGHDIIVGIFDTGIWPDSESFKEKPGMGPVPRTWKGKCVAGENFNPGACNRKLIGARYYFKGFEKEHGQIITNATTNSTEHKSALDFLGHGTHTASTAAGNVVPNVSFSGFAQGTARGGAPRARIAVYKVCWSDVNRNGRCSDADIIAAFDDALHDGVHVISASFGTTPPSAPFFESAADIGSFHAMQFGVSVVFSAGNDGPDPALVQNVAPWGLSVAASSIDRSFPTQIALDNKVYFTGESLITKQINARLVGSRPYFLDGVCSRGNWNKRTAVGRVVLCVSTVGPVTSGEAELAVRKLQAAALIFVEPPNRQIADVDIIPTVRVDFIQGTQIANYLAESILKPVVQIFPGSTVIKKSPAPVVAYFSSRGPSSLSPDILKPDVSGPGVGILAAWPPTTPPTLLPYDVRSVNWNFQSGTSMSCPHVSGVVALMKSAHPHWSPAAIKSALMTTAYTRDTTHDTILAGGSIRASDPFDIGSGHINPLKALDPGLVYDTKTNDYILFLCNSGYTEDQIEKMVFRCPGTRTICPRGYKANTNINYPSITVLNLQTVTTIKRTVRNVGHKKLAFYFARVVNPNGVEILVWPRVLIFTCFKKEISYYVTLKPVKCSQGRFDFGEIVWSDGFHYVRSPVVVHVNTTSTFAYGGDTSGASMVDHASI